MLTSVLFTSSWWQISLLSLRHSHPKHLQLQKSQTATWNHLFLVRFWTKKKEKNNVVALKSRVFLFFFIRGDLKRADLHRKWVETFSHLNATQQLRLQESQNLRGTPRLAVLSSAFCYIYISKPSTQLAPFEWWHYISYGRRFYPRRRRYSFVLPRPSSTEVGWQVKWYSSDICAWGLHQWAVFFFFSPSFFLFFVLWN